MRRIRLALALCLALTLTAPAAALAAPGVQVLLDPSAPGAAPVVTATVTQDAGDSPASRLTLLFPASFSLQPAPAGAAACAAATDCSRESEIGSLEANAAGVKTVGTVHRGSGSNLFAVVRGGGALSAGLVLPGSVTTRPTGLHAISFDGLPATPLSSFTLRLTGGDRGLVRTPSFCGAQLVEARLTTHSGDLAVAATHVDIKGCAATVSKVRAAKGAKLSWMSVTAGPVRIEVQRRAGKRWRRVRTIRRTARAGVNRLRVKRLKKGTYRFAVKGSDGRAVASRSLKVR